MERSARRRGVEQRRGAGAGFGALLLERQAREHSRLAEEVHDEVLQSMIAAAIQLEVLATRLEDRSLAHVAETARQATISAIEHLRAIVLDLQPPELPGGDLAAALAESVQRYRELGGPAVRLDTSGARRLSADEVALFARIAREALANAYKHAAASAVTLRVRESAGGIELVVRDDGRGFDVDAVLERPGHLGLSSIAARAGEAGGTCEIISRPGSGTTLRVRIPHRAA